MAHGPTATWNSAGLADLGEIRFFPLGGEPPALANWEDDPRLPTDSLTVLWEL